MAFSCTSATSDGTATVTTAGEIDLSTTPAFKQVLREAVDGADRVIVDLTEVSFCDSTGLGVLAGVLRRARQRGTAMCLVGVTGEVARVMRITHLDQLFPMHPTRDDALAVESDTASM